MDGIKTDIEFSLNYIKTFLKWIFISLIVGTVGGILGSVFHLCIDYVTDLRGEYSFLLYLLPIGGLVIVLLYYLLDPDGKIDTNRVIKSVRENKRVPLVMIPLIFISTVITHMLGGSAGREGAALQLGGSVGYNLGKVIKLNKRDMRIIVMSGMSSVFAALFGTPITAAIFSIEVTNVGVMHYAGLMPGVISAVTASQIAKQFSLHGVAFKGIEFPAVTLDIIVQIAVLAVMCALISIIFCTAIKKCEHTMDRFIKNPFMRAFAGGSIIVLSTILLGTYDYNGAGMNVIERAMQGEANPEAFLIKIIFTAITISAGFKGGEIVPAFFIGSTFGCVMGNLLGLNPAIAAAIGFVSVFCGVVNCPIASMVLSLEVFGAEGLIFFALACSISYMMSGCFGLYKSQKIVYSKLDDDYIDITTR